MKNLIRINKKDKLYVLQCGAGFSCYGFDILFNKSKKLSDELNRPDLLPKSKGTKKAYSIYLKLIELAHNRYKLTGIKSNIDLTPQLNGLEGYRVEVIDNYNEKRRFYVGRSSGWIPCHLEIARSDSSGGPSVTGTPFKSIKVIY